MIGLLRRRRIAMQGRARGQIADHAARRLRFLGWARTLAVERQAHGNARTLANAAADSEFTAMQMHQALDDGETEPGAALATVIRTAGLEIRLADPRQILVADADTV